MPNLNLNYETLIEDLRNDLFFEELTDEELIEIIEYLDK